MGKRKLFLLVNILLSFVLFSYSTAFAAIPDGVKNSYTYNQTDRSIVKVKERLKTLGYFSKDAQFSNVVSEELRKAVISFQNQNGMTTDGIIDKDFLETLFSSSAVSKDGIKKRSNNVVSSSSGNGIMKSNNVESSSSGGGLKWILIIIGGFIVISAISKTGKQQSSTISYFEMRKLKKGGLTYSNGHEYERYVAAWLKMEGFTNVVITPKSGDYGADVLATSPKGVRYAIQCKLYSKPVGYRAIEEVISGMHYYGCNAGMVVTNNTYTRQAYEAARRMGVVLKQGVR